MNAFLDELVRNLSSPLSRLILQILVILLVARLCGILVRYLGQPQVIGEILAGISRNTGRTTRGPSPSRSS
jgi:hypothetical protein